MAGLLARGSRHFAAFPTCRLRTRQWHKASARRLQLRGQPWDCIESPETLDAYHIPSSLSHMREAILARSKALPSCIVNDGGNNAVSAYRINNYFLWVAGRNCIFIVVS